MGVPSCANNHRTWAIRNTAGFWARERGPEWRAWPRPTSRADAQAPALFVREGPPASYQSGVLHHVVDIGCILWVLLGVHIDLHGLHRPLQRGRHPITCGPGPPREGERPSLCAQLSSARHLQAAFCAPTMPVGAPPHSRHLQHLETSGCRVGTPGRILTARLWGGKALIGRRLPGDSRGSLTRSQPPS